MYQSLNDIQKKRFFNSVLAVAVTLAIFLAVLTLNAIKEGSNIGRNFYPANVISVYGTGEVFAIPDTGSFSFSVVEEGKTVKEAQDKASKKINTTLDAVRALGVAEKDIKTTGYNSYPKYEYQQQTKACAEIYCPPGKQVLTGYEVSQTISVKVRNTADAGAVLTKVGDLGVSNISNLDFVIDDMDAVNAQARDKAILDAKEKAKVLAKALGVRLVRIVSFNEGGGYPIPYAMGGAMEKVMSADAVSMPPQTPVGENEIISNVTITYEVR